MIVNVPLVAVLATVNVNVLELVAGFVLKAAVVPLCKPETERDTLPVKPFNGVIFTDAVPLDPRATLKLVGDTDNEKLGPALTVSEITVELVRLPEPPLTVTLNVPVAAVAEAVKVTVLLVKALCGLKDAMTPLGNPVAVRLTLELKPFS